jgi:CBS domain-containing protein
VKSALLSGRSCTTSLAVVDVAHSTRGVITVDGLLRWLAHGDGDVHQPVEQIVGGPLAVVAADTSVADAVLAMESAQVSALAITSTGTGDGQPWAACSVSNPRP